MVADFCSTDYKSKQDIFRHFLKLCQLKKLKCHECKGSWSGKICVELKPNVSCTVTISKRVWMPMCVFIYICCLCIDTHTYRRYCSASNFLPSIKLIANYFFLFFSQLNFYSSCGVFISAMQCGQSHQHFMSHVIWLLQFTMSSLSLLYSIQLGKWSVDLVINHLSFRFHMVQLRMGEWDRMHNERSYKYLFP